MDGPLDVQEDEHDGADHGAAEQQRAVLVDLAGLDGLQGVAAFRRDVARCVDRAVDDPLVDVAVDPVADRAADAADAVDDAVDACAGWSSTRPWRSDGRWRAR